MSDDEEVDASSLVDFSQVRQRTEVERAKLSVKALANGSVFVDWTELPKHPSLRRFLIHCRSLNNNRVNKRLFVFPERKTSSSV